jgi:hypothetical protein
MIAAVIPLTAEPKLSSNIHISLLIPLTYLVDPLNALFIALPRRSAEDALDLARFARGPLLKTLFMNIIATSGFAALHQTISSDSGANSITQTGQSPSIGFRLPGFESGEQSFVDD